MWVNVGGVGFDPTTPPQLFAKVTNTPNSHPLDYLPNKMYINLVS